MTSSEPVNGHGDGNTSPDWRITGDLTVDLRAERSGPGKGRVYTIKVEISDAAGNKVTRNVTVLVPHDMGKGRAGSHTPTSQSAVVAPIRVDHNGLEGSVRASRLQEN